MVENVGYCRFCCRRVGCGFRLDRSADGSVHHIGAHTGAARQPQAERFGQDYRLSQSRGEGRHGASSHIRTGLPPESENRKQTVCVT
jgi:hypothetical protein